MILKVTINDNEVINIIQHILNEKKAISHYVQIPNSTIFVEKK